MTTTTKNNDELLSAWELNPKVDVYMIEAVIQAIYNDYRASCKSVPSVVTWRLLDSALRHPDNHHLVTWDSSERRCTLKLGALERLIQKTLGMRNIDSVYCTFEREGAALKTCQRHGMIDWSLSPRSGAITLTFSTLEEIYVKALEKAEKKWGIDSVEIRELKHGLQWSCRGVKIKDIYPKCVGFARDLEPTKLSKQLRGVMIQPYVIWATGGYDSNPIVNKSQGLADAISDKDEEKVKRQVDCHNDFRTWRKGVDKLAERIGISPTRLKRINVDAELYSSISVAEEVVSNVDGRTANRVRMRALDMGKKGIRIQETHQSRIERGKIQKHNDNTPEDGPKLELPARRFNVGRQRPSIRKARKHAPKMTINGRSLKVEEWFVKKQQSTDQPARSTKQAENPTTSPEKEEDSEPSAKQAPKPNKEAKGHYIEVRTVKVKVKDRHTGAQKTLKIPYLQFFQRTDEDWWNNTLFAKHVYHLCGGTIANVGPFKRVMRISSTKSIGKERWRQKFLGKRLPYKEPGDVLAPSYQRRKHPLMLTWG